MRAVEAVERRTWGSSVRAGVVGALLVCLPAYFLMVIDDGVPAVAGTGVLLTSGRLVVAGTIVSGLVLATRRPTRRLGFGLLLGTAVASVIAAAAVFVFALWVLSTVAD